MQVYIDADACPVKDEVLRVAARHGLTVHMVSNSWMRLPETPLIHRVVVAEGADAADDWIAGRATRGDLVLTADIPLAARALEQGARCIDFRGSEFSPSRIGDALASRDLNAYLRSMGMVTGGPSAYAPKDRSKFASLLDAAVGKLARASCAT